MLIQIKGSSPKKNEKDAFLGGKFPKCGWVGWLIPNRPQITPKIAFLTQISPFVSPNLTKTLGWVHGSSIFFPYDGPPGGRGQSILGGMIGWSSARNWTVKALLNKRSHILIIDTLMILHRGYIVKISIINTCVMYHGCLDHGYMYYR